MDQATLEPSPYLEIDSSESVRIRGTRIDLCVLVEAYLDGHLPEQMVLDYPTLDLESVYGALTFYLANQGAVDRYVNLCRQRAGEYHTELARAPLAPVVARLRALKARTRAA